MEQVQKRAPVRFGWVKTITGVISVISISAALLGAFAIVLDVLGRWLFSTSVFALNEIMSTIFAVAIALTLPAGAASRVNLKIDLLSHLTGPRVTAWLKVAGAVMLCVFFSILSWRLFGLAVRYADQGRASALLQLPLASTYYAISAAMGAAAIVQVFNFIEDITDAIAEKREDRTHPIVWLIIAAFLVLTVGVAGWALTNFDGYSTYILTYPGTAAIIGFVLLWLGVLLQLPLATVTAMIGVSGSLAMIGGNASMNTFAGDAADFFAQRAGRDLADVPHHGGVLRCCRRLRRFVPPRPGPARPLQGRVILCNHRRLRRLWRRVRQLYRNLGHLWTHGASGDETGGLCADLVHCQCGSRGHIGRLGAAIGRDHSVCLADRNLHR
jgi:TRAP-type C4-dicarboxylate transport system permease small subunit